MLVVETQARCMSRPMPESMHIKRIKILNTNVCTNAAFQQCRSLVASKQHTYHSQVVVLGHFCNGF